MIIQHSMLTCIILQGSVTVLLVQNDNSSYHELAHDIIMQKIIPFFHENLKVNDDLYENISSQLKICLINTNLDVSPTEGLACEQVGGRP